MIIYKLPDGRIFRVGGIESLRDVFTAVYHWFTGYKYAKASADLFQCEFVERRTHTFAELTQLYTPITRSKSRDLGFPDNGK